MPGLIVAQLTSQEPDIVHHVIPSSEQFRPFSHWILCKRHCRGVVQQHSSRPVSAPWKPKLNKNHNPHLFFSGRFRRPTTWISSVSASREHATRRSMASVYTWAIGLASRRCYHSDLAPSDWIPHLMFCPGNFCVELAFSRPGSKVTSQPQPIKF
ncbi:hypothetical protein N656DRAFT_62653 [Canariomyces notabilis]|uniref:Uncharacterized protein n=1 Tax=Canariomyces notabilis TaxID=2074819 RepID=A0AAN6TPK0_9PEZI|nr:hypothetical protein N656DRAFT_62653 [Canariomyces arenarius]